MSKLMFNEKKKLKKGKTIKHLKLRVKIE